MNLLSNLFRRRAGFMLIAQTTFERMEQRHSVRPEFTIPQTYAELMVMHREIGHRCATNAKDTEELIWRSSNLQILQRQTLSLAVQGQIAPPVLRHIEKNIKAWQNSLRIKPEPVIRKFLRQLSFQF